MELRNRPRRLRINPAMRALVRETTLQVEDLIYPIFIVPGTAVKEEISSLPGQYHVSVDEAVKLAKEAYDLGILNKLVPAEELLSSAEELAAAIMKNAPLAVEKAKHVIQVGAELPLKNAIRLETEAEALLFSTEDKLEGMRAFVEKRKAVFNRK